MVNDWMVMVNSEFWKEINVMHNLKFCSHKWNFNNPEMKLKNQDFTKISSVCFQLTVLVFNTYVTVPPTTLWFWPRPKPNHWLCDALDKISRMPMTTMWMSIRWVALLQWNPRLWFKDPVTVLLKESMAEREASWKIGNLNFAQPYVSQKFSMHAWAREISFWKFQKIKPNLR